MTNPNLGRLERVELRQAWPHEAHDFTPWLSRPDNLKLLSETVGIALEPEAQEKYVGPFRADIFCKDAATDHWVVIENQLERTDHSHLGQALTYAAGLDAVTIIWIAERFTDEHRAAIDWLNEKTQEGISFFALELELWRIGDSPPAPKFNVVCKPNEWSRTVSEAASNSELTQLRGRYWAEFLKQPELQTILAGPVTPMRKGNQNFPTVWRDNKLTAYISVPKTTLGVYVTNLGENRVDQFHQLLAHKEEIEAELGASLDWDGNADWAMGVTWNLPQNDPTQEADWPRQHKLLASKIVAFYRALDPYVLAKDGQAPTTSREAV